MRCTVIQSKDPSLTRLMSRVSNYSNDTMEYLKRNHNNFMEKASVLGENFINNVNNTFNYFNDRQTIQSTMNNLQNSNAMVGDNIIYNTNMETITRPGYTMRRYVMANPEVYRLNNLNRLSGYEEEWFNNEPEVEDAKCRIDYLNTIDGIIQGNDNDDDGYYTIVSSNEDNPLSSDDKVNILNAWELMNLMIANGDDPTELE